MSRSSGKRPRGIRRAADEPKAPAGDPDRVRHTRLPHRRIWPSDLSRPMPEPPRVRRAPFDVPHRRPPANRHDFNPKGIRAVRVQIVNGVAARSGRSGAGAMKVGSPADSEQIAMTWSARMSCAPICRAGRIRARLLRSTCRSALRPRPIRTSRSSWSCRSRRRGDRHHGAPGGASACRRGSARPVVIENQGGAGGTIGAKQVATAAPDGYTLLMAAVANTFGTAPVLYKLDYDPMKAFAPVATVVVDKIVLVGQRRRCRSRPCRSSSPTPRPIRASSTTAPPSASGRIS